MLDWALSMANGAPKWQNSAVLAWDRGTERFFNALEALDKRLAAGDPLGAPAEKGWRGVRSTARTTTKRTLPWGEWGGSRRRRG